MEIVKGGREYFNKRYIKDHPYSLFIYEDTLEDYEFEDYSNVFPIITYDKDGRYLRDKHLEDNKKIIRECIEDIKKNLKRRRYKKLILPEKSIGKGKSKLQIVRLFCFKLSFKTSFFIKEILIFFFTFNFFNFVSAIFNMCSSLSTP